MKYRCVLFNFLCKLKYNYVFREELDKQGVCVRVIGNISLLPTDIQTMIAEAVLTTKHNTRWDTRM